MNVPDDLLATRLWNQRLAASTLRRPEDVVSWLGAVQAQEYPYARWSLAQRLADAVTDASVERAFDEGRILRTHVLRPTWHFLAPADIRWILKLSAPRVHTVNGYPYRTNGLDARTRAKGEKVIARALEGRQHLTRTELAEALRRARLPAEGQALAYIVMHAELEGLICSGPRRGKQFTYALMDERVPKARVLDTDEALVELSRRYFTSHGPATIRDFVWWSGLTVAQVRRGIGELGGALAQREIGGKTYYFSPDSRPPRLERPTVYLLQGYDEYLIAFKDREWTASRVSLTRPPGPPENFFQCLLIDGRLEGGWRRTLTTGGADLTVTSFGRLSTKEKAAIHAEADRYGAFLQRPIAVTIRQPRSVTTSSPQ